MKIIWWLKKKQEDLGGKAAIVEQTTTKAYVSLSSLDHARDSTTTSKEPSEDIITSVATTLKVVVIQTYVSASPDTNTFKGYNPDAPTLFRQTDSPVMTSPHKSIKE